jgi:hypothetical protein
MPFREQDFRRDDYLSDMSLSVICHVDQQASDRSGQAFLADGSHIFEPCDIDRPNTCGTSKEG